MTINIKTKNIELSSAIRSYVEEKIGSVKKHIHDLNGDAVLADVEVGKTTDHHNKGELFRAEVNLEVGGKLYRAEATADDLYAAIDDVKDELIREVRTSSERKETLFRRGGRAIKNFLKFGRK